MKVITIAGKVDSRALVYPLARALSLNGMTAIVSDDGSYRRLFKGKGNKGTVSGIDISVGVNMDELLKNSLNSSGVPYDNLIVVSSNYIPKDTTSLILCHGFDNSIGQEIEEVKEVKETPKKEKKKKKGAKAETPDSIQDENKVSLIKEEVTPEIIDDSDDSFDFDSSIPNVEIFISYNRPVDKYAKGILLRDGLMQYVYGCEEQKSLSVVQDKNINKLLTSLVSDVLGIDKKMMLNLLCKSEYKNGKDKKTKK